MKPNHREFDTVVAGYLGVDLAPNFPRSMPDVALSELLRPGRLIEVGDLTISLGGVVANTGLALKRFGKRVALMALVGRDLLGDLALQILEGHDLARGICQTESAGTAYAIVIAPPGSDRIFLESPGCNAEFSSTDIDYSVVARSRLFHFGYPTLMRGLYDDGGAQLENMFARVRELGVATSLDLSLPDPGSPAGKADWRSILKRVLPLVDVFVPSIEEMLFTLAPEEYERLSSEADGNIIDAIPQDLYRTLGKEIIDMGVKALLVKASHRGGYLRTGADTALQLPARDWENRELWIPPCPVETTRMVNASGAGDAAVAAFLAALLNGEKPEAAGHYAMLAGRDNLYGADAVSGLSDWESMTGNLLAT